MQVNKSKFQLILPSEHKQKAIEGCHEQTGHLGNDRMLEVLRDRFYWPGMQDDVISHIDSCLRCLRRKDISPLINNKTKQAVESVHLDYLEIEPSKGNIEIILIITDHFTRYAYAFPSKSETAIATAKPS